MAKAEAQLQFDTPSTEGSTSQCPALDGARLENRHLLAALFHLAKPPIL